MRALTHTQAHTQAATEFKLTVIAEVRLGGGKGRTLGRKKGKKNKKKLSPPFCLLPYSYPLFLPVLLSL